MNSCKSCIYANLPLNAKGGMAHNAIGTCTYDGELTPQCNRNGAVFAILPWTGADCPAWSTYRPQVFTPGVRYSPACIIFEGAECGTCKCCLHNASLPT